MTFQELLYIFKVKAMLVPGKRYITVKKHMKSISRTSKKMPWFFFWYCNTAWTKDTGLILRGMVFSLRSYRCNAKPLSWSVIFFKKYISYDVIFSNLCTKLFLRHWTIGELVMKHFKYVIRLNKPENQKLSYSVIPSQGQWFYVLILTGNRTRYLLLISCSYECL